MAAAVTAGAEAIAARVAASGAGRAVRLTIAAAGVLIAFAFFGSFALRERAFHQRLDPPTVAPFRALTEAEGLIGSAPVLVSVDNDVANAWAVYFLRHHAIRLLDYRGYMAQPHVKPLMDRAAPVDITTASYVLSDDGRAGGRDVVWQNGRFVLWRIPPSGAAFLVGVANPNGTERLNGRSFYWIGQGETIVDVVATADGAAALSASFVRGPSLPNVPVRRLRDCDSVRRITDIHDRARRRPIADRPGAPWRESPGRARARHAESRAPIRARCSSAWKG